MSFSLSGSNIDHKQILLANALLPHDGESGGSSLVAIEAHSGQQLWRSAEIIAVPTVPISLDLNGDGVPDIIAGGRGLPDSDTPLIAVDGTSGETIWRIRPIFPPWQNIYTPVAVADLDADGIPDILVSSGGDHLRPAYTEPTVSGRLALISGRTGDLLASISLPESQEIYSSPLIISAPQGDYVIIGSGGEYYPGDLWGISVSDILAQDITKFEKILDGDGSSFIAPSSASKNDHGDGFEIVVLRTDGVVFFLEMDYSSSFAIKWQNTVLRESVERGTDGRVLAGLSAPAIDKSTAGIITTIGIQVSTITRENLSIGNYEETGTVVATFDAQDGSIKSYIDIPDASSMSSPLLVEMEGESYLLCGCSSGGDDPNYPESSLALLNLATGEAISLHIPIPRISTPLASTDDSGKGELYLAVEYSDESMLAEGNTLPTGILKLSTRFTPKAWRMYMGPEHRGSL